MPASGSTSTCGGPLWKRSILPLTQADPFGGVIITDWYSPERPNERFKLNVYILDTELRADGVKVAVFRQTSGENGWQDAAVDPQTSTNIEDSILTRARELRITAECQRLTRCRQVRPAFRSRRRPSTVSQS